jgi:hypothetical protein
MISLQLGLFLVAVNTVPQNIFFDHYTLIPRLGIVKSIATSTLQVFAINDNYLLIFDKSSLRLERTIYFEDDIELLGYDRFTNDLWITGSQGLIRFTLTSFSTREYALANKIQRMGIDIDNVYLDGARDFVLNKRTSMIKPISTFPGNLDWFKKTSDQDIKSYNFLMPYYFYDAAEQSQNPFAQFNITAIYDNGMDLYVGTAGYGLLRYNKVSWLKQRVVYGPLDNQLLKVRKFNDQVFFVSDQGISYRAPGQEQWQYYRFTDQISDMLYQDNSIIVSLQNRIMRNDQGVLITITNTKNNILCLGADQDALYIGTASGLYKMYKGTSTLIPFGPDNLAVYAVYPADNEIFVGGEIGFYKYDRTENKWSKELGFGIKQIAQLHGALYLLSTNNQIIQYNNTALNDNAEADTAWVLLPYFNVYDIAADNEVVYCASYAGVYYYEPETEAYKVVYNLPQIKYNNVYVMNGNIIAVSLDNIYSLPINYRD